MAGLRRDRFAAMARPEAAGSMRKNTARILLEFKKLPCQIMYSITTSGGIVSNRGG